MAVDAAERRLQDGLRGLADRVATLADATERQAVVEREVAAVRAAVDAIRAEPSDAVTSGDLDALRLELFAALADQRARATAGASAAEALGTRFDGLDRRVGDADAAHTAALDALRVEMAAGFDARLAESQAVTVAQAAALVAEQAVTATDLAALRTALETSLGEGVGRVEGAAPALVEARLRATRAEVDRRIDALARQAAEAVSVASAVEARLKERPTVAIDPDVRGDMERLSQAVEALGPRLESLAGRVDAAESQQAGVAESAHGAVKRVSAMEARLRADRVSRASPADGVGRDDLAALRAEMETKLARQVAASRAELDRRMGVVDDALAALDDHMAAALNRAPGTAAGRALARPGAPDATALAPLRSDLQRLQAELEDVRAAVGALQTSPKPSPRASKGGPPAPPAVAKKAAPTKKAAPVKAPRATKGTTGKGAPPAKSVRRKAVPEVDVEPARPATAKRAVSTKRAATRGTSPLASKGAARADASRATPAATPERRPPGGVLSGPAEAARRTAAATRNVEPVRKATSTQAVRAATRPDPTRPDPEAPPRRAGLAPRVVGTPAAQPPPTTPRFPLSVSTPMEERAPARRAPVVRPSPPAPGQSDADDWWPEPGRTTTRPFDVDEPRQERVVPEENEVRPRGLLGRLSGSRGKRDPHG
jgi:hypothetical protein